jgi:6-phosphofructo-2-kinase/fructose-2,6-biphosphatase 2
MGQANDQHGESMYNVEGKIGGDSDLSERGWQYAKALPALIKDNIGDKPFEVSWTGILSANDLSSSQVWTSTLQRTQQTGSFLPFQKKTWKSLDELDAGVCDGMTYEEIEVRLATTPGLTAIPLLLR